MPGEPLAHTPAATDAVLRRLSGYAPLAADEAALLRQVTARPVPVPARTELVRDGEAAPRPQVLLEGWACRQRLLADGRRQIVVVLLPGDLIGLDQRRRPLPFGSVATLTPAQICEAGALRDAADGGRTCGKAAGKETGLAAALRQAREMEEIWLVNQVVRLGRQTAYERVAHFLLELRERLAAVDRVQENRFSFPITQEVLADALGLSVVHMNRTMQQLRRDGLVEQRATAITLRDVPALVSIADYTGTGDTGIPRA
ncbi:cAMP-binding domain of CRP or a regulatory subunit of cAMP-dependent protein kinases [Methylobacterium sp. 174MFSha1.1]|uniref:Crp/Fnr family transcriptional regulator n=1 Tax=Methylobacterium sp. 174MFSha1.1 TaxID=1502749 RepID=UPI0008F433B3|nr:Crp/Fnr family transcriptional regulator [Methylobacterium sp. 174MFSha1.1]SFV14757.1 cAMP-binding domain of CRP or a regulatory subunit of cAMP-dependent protein kinases [Methylobacterium sp. 174MFSha1.1]